jgi:hypothetical protein
VAAKPREKRESAFKAWEGLLAHVALLTMPRYEE